MRDSVDDMISQWSRQEPGLDTSPLEVVGRILACAHELHRDLSASLATVDLTYGDFDVINTLRRRGERAGTNPRELSRSSLITAGAMTIRLDRLEQAGLIERRADPADRRGSLVRLTPAGRRRARRALQIVLERDERFLAPLTPSQRRSAATVLRVLLSAAQQPVKT